MLKTSHTAWEDHTESFAPGQHGTDRQGIVCCAQGKSSPDVKREDEHAGEVQGKGYLPCWWDAGKGHALWTLTQEGQDRPCSVSQLKPTSWHTLRGQAGLLPVELGQLSCSPGDSTAAQGQPQEKALALVFCSRVLAVSARSTALTRSPRKLLETSAGIMTDARRMRNGGITSHLVSLAMAWI